MNRRAPGATLRDVKMAPLVVVFAVSSAIGQAQVSPQQQGPITTQAESPGNAERGGNSSFDWGNLAAVLVAAYAIINDRRQWAEQKRVDALASRRERLTESYPPWLQGMVRFITFQTTEIRRRADLNAKIADFQKEGRKPNEAEKLLLNRLREDMRQCGQNAMDANNQMHSAALAIRINERADTASKIAELTNGFTGYHEMTADAFAERGKELAAAAERLVEDRILELQEEASG